MINSKSSNSTWGCIWQQSSKCNLNLCDICWTYVANHNKHATLLASLIIILICVEINITTKLESERMKIQTNSQSYLLRWKKSLSKGASWDSTCTSRKEKEALESINIGDRKKDGADEHKEDQMRTLFYSCVSSGKGRPKDLLKWVSVSKLRPKWVLVTWG